MGTSQCVIRFPFFVLLVLIQRWAILVEHHSFWNHAYRLFDLPGALSPERLAQLFVKENGSSVAPRTVSSPYQHFSHVTHLSCVVCRFANPTTSVGLTTARRQCYSMNTGLLNCCKDHYGRFCGVCLSGESKGLLVTANEDEESFPQVENTCEHCRRDRFRAVVSRNPAECQRIQQVQSDPYTRLGLDMYVTDGEGTVSALMDFLRERVWLTRNTRIVDMAGQALAASKYDDVEMEYSDSEEEEEEEDYSVSEGNVRSTALDDWARHRIMDGHWISPADVWYQHKPVSGFELATPPAIHPCPWSLEDQDEEPRPSPVLVNSEIPPSFKLCEQAFMAHSRVMRSTLLPAMHNVVRKLVMECGIEESDPAIKASRMTLENVLRELHDETIWFEGVDWIERRRNDSSEGTTSDYSTVSDSSSPANSTSTMRTTPSPTPDHKVHIAIPVAPTLDPPQLIHHIPFIPETTAYFPQYTYEAFRAVWREACAPLYHCRCSICERAMRQATAANEGSKPTIDEQAVDTKVYWGPREEEEEEEVMNESVDIDGDSIISYDDEPDSPVGGVKRSSEEVEYDVEQGPGGKRVKL